MIKVEYSNFTEDEYTSMDDARDAILVAHSVDVGVVDIYDVDDDNIRYSLLWDVTLQEER